MKKEYQKPEVEIISLTAQENLATLSLNDVIDGETGTESSPF